MTAKTAVLLAVIISISALLTGCWDLKEPNQISYVYGSGWDVTDDGKIELSVLIPLPREIGTDKSAGSGGKPYTVVSATGKNIFDASKHIQEKTSRSMFAGYRQALFINEEAAKRDIMQLLDELIRNPESNTRASLFVIKGTSAKKLMENEYVMEKFSPYYASRTAELIGYRKNTIYDLERESTSPTRCFVLPVITLDSNGTDRQLHIQEIALFNNEHRMIGYLKDNDTYNALWAAGKLSSLMITQPISQGNGTISLQVQKLKRHVKAVLDGEHVKIDLKLSGIGLVPENNTNLDLLKPEIKNKVSKEMNEKVQNDVRQMIEKVQKQFKTDIFGFGNEIGWKHPEQWKKMRDHWEDTFSNMEVSVKVNLTIQGVGQVGSGPKIKE